jgi:hypothetical protein
MFLGDKHRAQLKVHQGWRQPPDLTIIPSMPDNPFELADACGTTSNCRDTRGGLR